MDPEGTFKYIQIRLREYSDSTKSRIVVRGYKSCAYHADILDKFEREEIESKNLSGVVKADCPGGGRIKHEPKENKLFIYGYS